MDDGGVLALYDRSILQYSTDSVTDIEFTGNSALHKGGALYIEDEGYTTYDDVGQALQCALWLYGTNTINASAFSMTLVNNTALYSGSAIYGGWLDVCDQAIYPHYFMKFNAPSEDPSVVSSNPSRVCICVSFVPQCNITDYEIAPLYPGQSFQIAAVAVGQRFGTTPSFVLAAFTNNSIQVDSLQKVQSVDKYCTSLNFTIKSPNEKEHLLLTVDREHVPAVPKPKTESIWTEFDNSLQNIQQMSTLLIDKRLSISIPLLKCPLGYRFDPNSSTCLCKEGLKCDTNTYSIVRTRFQWINATFEHLNKEELHGVLVHDHCPLDYCIDSDQLFHLESPFDQCNFKRSGILCGACQGNLSQIFGTNKCEKCSSLWTLLVIPLFLMLGLALVALIIVLNLTVAQGTLDALIFYANIVSANQATFFPTEMANSFFRWYIAWLNLDVGVETCFMGGLDAYTKTWLQFLFPFYIWFLVILIIVASRHSSLAARISGENAVPALATLFLLSYTKLLRVTITTFSSTQLKYPDGYIRRVWLYDGNIDFLEAKHAILYVAALFLLVFLSVPYTLVLFTIQWLQRLPYHCLLSWVWKLKPLFDAHTGPYKEKHRYWAGMLLIVRGVLFVIFFLNFRNDPSLNLFTILITSICLLTYLAYLGGVHRALYLDILEYVFLLNLGVLSGATFYTRLTEGSQDKVIKTSVSIVLMIFIAVLFTHAYIKVKSTQKGSHFIDKVGVKFHELCAPVVTLLSRFGIVKRIVNNSQGKTTSRATPSNTHSSIELKEPLLAAQVLE